MKVLFVHEGYLFRKNGNVCSYAYSKKTVQRYKAIAEEVVFLSREDNSLGNDGQYNVLDEPGFKFVGVKNFKSLKGLRNLSEVKKTVRRTVEDADFIMARVSDLGFYATQYAKQLNKPVLVEVVGCSRDALWHHSLQGKLLAVPSFLKEKKMVKNAHYVLYVTQFFLQKRYPSGAKTLACSNVELGETDNSIVDKRIKKIDGMENKTITLGTLAAVDLKYKGFETAIKAIKQLVNEGYAIQYRIAGPGNSEWLQKIINRYQLQGSVMIQGPIQHDHVFEWLDTIDIYIQPSITEGLPRALIEAMSRACPCIGSNAGGIGELLTESYMFPKKDDKALTKLLRSIRKEDLIECSRANYERAKDYRQEVLENRRNQFYREFSETLEKGTSNE